MAKLPTNPLISEILQKAHNAKTKEEKASVLRENESPALKKLLIWNFDESIRSVLPDGEVPYTPNDAPAGTEHTRLVHEHRTFHNFVEGGNNDLSQTRKEMMFVQLLEGLHESEAEVLCLVKDKKLGKKYRITQNVVAEAFPSIEWGNRT
ncbi:DNA ligase [Synechococcus phage DSL-LC02]|nr:DNA ligase [Synechococcus phage DSL-LC02]